MKKFLTLNDSWQNYKKEVIPSDADKIQIIETRRAFYGGALSVFSTLTRLTDNNLTEEQASVELSKIEEELKQFVSLIGKDF